jgi:putative sterol carrier protein
MSEITVAELMSRMPQALRPEAAEGVDTLIQFHLTGEEGGDWAVTIKDGKCTVVEGTADNPKMTLTADALDYKNVVTGKMNPMQAFMTGKLKLAGDLTQAMKLPNYFKMG